MKLKNSKILLTGGMGFIGSHIARLLVKKGARVTIFDNFSSGFWENIADIKNEVKVIKGDILDFDKLCKETKGYDAISHQAAQLEIEKCINDPIEDLTTNTIGTLNVFKSAVENRVKKVISASTAGVYGQLVNRPQMEDSHPLQPNWQYGVSKLAAEKYANIFYEMHKLPVYSLRYSIVYGPNEWYGRVLSIFLKKALENKDLPIFGKGDQTRDFVYVEDIAELNIRALEIDIDDHVIINGSSNIETSINKLADTVIKALCKKNINSFRDSTVKEGKMSKYIGRIRLPSELKAMCMSNKKACELLGWKPKVGLAEGIKKEYDWLKRNAKQWSKIKI